MMVLYISTAIIGVIICLCIPFNTRPSEDIILRITSMVELCFSLLLMVHLTIRRYRKITDNKYYTSPVILPAVFQGAVLGFFFLWPIVYASGYYYMGNFHLGAEATGFTLLFSLIFGIPIGAIAGAIQRYIVISYLSSADHQMKLSDPPEKGRG